MRLIFNQMKLRAINYVSGILQTPRPLSYRTWGILPDMMLNIRYTQTKLSINSY